MVSLWGSRKDDDPQQNGINGESSDRMVAQEPHDSEADERTRLLPRQPPPPAEDT